MITRFRTCVLLFLLPTAMWAESYRVGVNDRLHVQIAVWDELHSVVTEMPGVSGSYPIGTGGNIAVPLAGSFPAVDRTLDEIAADIEAALSAYVGIGQTAGAAVSVDSYAPIYISGQVKTPGVYAYTPGLTVQQALSIAGGTEALDTLEGEERNFLTARGTISVLQHELIFLTAKRDRLIAEIDQNTEFTPDGTDIAPAAWAAEEAILQARNARYDYELQSIARARATLEEATAVLQDKLETNRTQLEAGQTELEREEDLVERGLAAPIRVFERATYVNELESRLLDIERTIVLAQQDTQELERSEGVLIAVRNEENATSLQEVEAQIAEIDAQLMGQYDLLSAAAGRQITQLQATDPSAPAVSYSITRMRGEPTTLDADKQTLLMPGDALEVTPLDLTAATPSN
ncbi:exopolysaccharide production protein ExoF [Yoonia maricola]|uniref:Exopolysaccharide production protein ExoF n=2 Tax=Yoonia maricola TaxID=420999 RepID=A0A2M8WKL5_9RHOB|nr:exopolysaccharide production protein ExoF [Yoonia maricola]